MVDSYYNDFGISSNKRKQLANEIVFNLYTKPKKDKGLNMPRFQHYAPNAIHQADLLFLPDDNGFKYALVVVDIGSRLVDAEPLETKSSEQIVAAFKKIYQRGILKKPKIIEIDPGTEFKGATREYFEENGISSRVCPEMQCL